MVGETHLETEGGEGEGKTDIKILKILLNTSKDKKETNLNLNSCFAFFKKGLEVPVVTAGVGATGQVVTMVVVRMQLKQDLHQSSQTLPCRGNWLQRQTPIR